jgi:hypothetical protein
MEVVTYVADNMVTSYVAVAYAAVAYALVALMEERREDVMVDK